MNLRPVPVYEVARMVGAGARLVDIRDPADFACGHIPGAVNHPLATIANLALLEPGVFVCASGKLAQANAAALAGCQTGRGYVLEGGFDAWRAAGLPVAADRLEVVRQVKIVAGLMILVSVFMSLAIAPIWLALAVWAGIGLSVGGLTGWCGLAELLQRMPWNRRSAS